MGVKGRIKSGIRKLFRLVRSCIPEKKVEAKIVTLGFNDLLKGKTALITGGTSGIGKSIALAFVNSGANVIITGRSHKRVNSIVDEINGQSKKNNCKGCVLDLSDSLEIQKALGDILSNANNRIDILVNSAGVSKAPSDDIIQESANFDIVLNTNLKGAYLLSKLVSKHMIEKNIKGNILFIASTSSARPATNAYSMSKWGIRGLIIGLAKVLINDGIVVNGIAPGPTATPMMGKMECDPNINLPNNPSGRFAMPEEIASMAVVLTSGLGRLVVGDIVYMGGGSGVITVDDINY